LREGHIPRDTYIKAGDTYRFNIDAIEKALTKRDDKVEDVLPYNEH
jgi:hypothetical protein